MTIFLSDMETCFAYMLLLPVGHSSGTSPKGFPLEGKGISPNYLVSMKVNDFLSGKDTQLSYALQLLQK